MLEREEGVRLTDCLEERFNPARSQHRGGRKVEAEEEDEEEDNRVAFSMTVQSSLTC